MNQHLQERLPDGGEEEVEEEEVEVVVVDVVVVDVVEE